MKAGGLRDIAVFERRGGSGDQFGAPSTEWQEVARRPVEFLEGAGNEYFEGGIIHSQVKARLKVRTDTVIAGIPVDARVYCRGKYWSIISIVDTSGLLAASRGTLEFRLDYGSAT